MRSFLRLLAGDVEHPSQARDQHKLIPVQIDQLLVTERSVALDHLIIG
eukprot:CAMPEP_0168613224 /NCGR_PEP_ID=MMETSP0449_2-20121227/3339_1 /TAXON_ID=1082188 /ORGANISM="Strombidium rassoulzadegani, Strain ras09" /LENGTH=47 /DNA_ID= /DNA_START= /DNA_END= /DNA_ORIENTATION=